MNLHVSETALASNARRRAFHQRIAATHAHKVMKGIDPSPYWAGMWMWDLVEMSPRPRRTSLDQVISAVCGYYDLTKTELLSQSRHANSVRARHVACYLARKCTRFSSAVVGDKFCRDHSVVLYAQAKITDRIKVDPLLAQEVKDLMGRLA